MCPIVCVCLVDLYWSVWATVELKRKVKRKLRNGAINSLPLVHTTFMVRWFDLASCFDSASAAGGQSHTGHWLALQPPFFAVVIVTGFQWLLLLEERKVSIRQIFNHMLLQPYLRVYFLSFPQMVQWSPHCSSTVLFNVACSLVVAAAVEQQMTLILTGENKKKKEDLQSDNADGGASECCCCSYHTTPTCCLPETEHCCRSSNDWPSGWL